MGRNYYEENLEDFAASIGAERLPPRLHVGAYPLPAAKLREFAAASQGESSSSRRGLPSSRRRSAGSSLRGSRFPASSTAELPRTGELNPDNVRAALGLAPRPSARLDAPALPNRPPQLCQGCPHADSYAAVAKAVEGLPLSAIFADIGCYALGALPPFGVPEALVCMGASIGMAVGAAEAGYENVVGFIGDSTFLHSGVTPLIDAVSRNAPVTIVILDNSIVAMTGGQPTILPSARLEEIVKGIGVDPGPRRDDRRFEGRGREERRDLPPRDRASRRVGHYRPARMPRGDQGEEEKRRGRHGRGQGSLRSGGGRMTCDIVLAGVGGQGVLSIAAIIAGAAMSDGLKVRQSEVHGMAQRGGAVSAHLRLSDSTIRCDLIASGGADMILSMEPVESLRYLPFLKAGRCDRHRGGELREYPGLPRLEPV